MHVSTTGLTSPARRCETPSEERPRRERNQSASPPSQLPEMRSPELRMLVGIASYGEKNLLFLKRIIQDYRSLEMQVDIVVFSDAPKDVGPGVEVIAGLPVRDPWSLPFAHKPVFASRLESYDLFAYSEDDMEVTAANIDAFLRAIKHLAPDELPGFLRYEVDSSGNLSVPEAHASAHWKPETVKQRGDYTVAEFSNEHAAFYLLTREQLRSVIASGNFLRPPHEGRFDMACTAATDPYTVCGFRKVICISHFDDFLIHHVPNRYAGQLGLPLQTIKDQVGVLMDVRKGQLPATTLCNVETKVLRGKWSKQYDETAREEVLALVPGEAKTILSIGCGWGATELELHRRGFNITVFPLDSVAGVAVERLGLETIYGTMMGCFDKVQRRTFDCVLLTDLLHLLADPHETLWRAASLVADRGTLLVCGPNFYSARLTMKRLLKGGDYRKLGRFDLSGVKLVRLGYVERQIRRAGLCIMMTRWARLVSGPAKFTPGRPLCALTHDAWIIKASRIRRWQPGKKRRAAVPAVS